jgi:TRAP-type C4-dicarboxylate transport system permease small subunit
MTLLPDDIPARRGAFGHALDTLYLTSGVLGALALAAICIVMLTGVVFRELGQIFRGADDITAWLCAGAAFLPLAHTFRKGELIRVGLYIDRLSGPRRHAIELFALGVAVAAAAYLAYWLGMMTYDSWMFDDRGQGLLPIPIWIPQAPLVFGAAVLFVAMLDDLVILLMGGVPSYERAERDRRARGEMLHEI